MNNQFKKVVSLSIISAFVFASPFGIVAKAEKPNGNGSKSKTTITRENSIKEKIEEKKEKGENTKEKILGIKNKIGKEDVQKRLKEAKKLENYQDLLLDIKKARTDLKEIKEEMKKIRFEMKKLIKNAYSQEELNHLRQRAEEIVTKNPGVKVIPIENIIKQRGTFKFDTPPVIKEGRTLIPVRAITEGLGANVTWNGEERTVTVSKEDVEIVFQLEDGKVFVNGEETSIDVPAQIMNNRTIVPLRFISEQLGLKVDYDQETETIEIDEEEIEEEVDENQPQESEEALDEQENEGSEEIVVDENDEETSEEVVDENTNTQPSTEASTEGTN